MSTKAATIDDLIGILQTMKTDHGGDIMITVCYTDDGSDCDATLELTDFQIGENKWSHKKEVRINI